jgi:thiosulfate/3-mercaptopyruvate sulfurtransferase
MSDFQLITPESTEQCLDVEDTERSLVLLEAHFSSIDHPEPLPDTRRRHLPGALEIHPSYLEAGTNRAKYYPHYDNPADGNLLSDLDLQVALEKIGITQKTPVIIYGSEPDGVMSASRVAWGLLYAGVETVRLLDGGLDAWMMGNRPTVTQIDKADEVALRSDSLTRPIHTWKARHEILATTAEVREVVLRPDTASAKLIDVRSRGEWDGTCTQHYPFYSSAGHIPNAIYQGDWETLIDHNTQKIQPHLDAVAQRWRELGILDSAVERGEVTLIFYCGTGWRSSIAFLEAQLLGLPAKNYDDGFYGWACTEK